MKLMSLSIFARRQMKGPKMQYEALFDTLVLSEKGVYFELLETHLKVWNPPSFNKNKTNTNIKYWKKKK